MLFGERGLDGEKFGPRSLVTVWAFFMEESLFRKKRRGLLCCIVMQIIFRFSLLSLFDFNFCFPSLFYSPFPSCKSVTIKKKKEEEEREKKKKKLKDGRGRVKKK